MIRKVNRFLALVSIDGRVAQAHIPNSGRLAELMTPGLSVILEPADKPERKTSFTLKSVRFQGRWVCVDSTLPNALAEQMAKDTVLPLFEGYSQVRREVSMGAHRFDMRLDGEGKKPMIVEVKSVTLVKDGVAMFPDAPTIRGASHLRALAALGDEGMERLALFIILRSDASSLLPNLQTDPEFTKALRDSQKAGVHMRAVKCAVGERNVRILGPVEIGM